MGEDRRWWEDWGDGGRRWGDGGTDGVMVGGSMIGDSGRTGVMVGGMR